MSQARLLAAGGVTAGDYVRISSLFFAVAGSDGGIDRIVFAERGEDIPALDSDEWRNLGPPGGIQSGIFEAIYCHRLRAPSRSSVPSGFWSRFAKLFNSPELRPLAERWDCRCDPWPLRFLSRSADDSVGRLLFEYGGVEFSLDPTRRAVCAEHVVLPKGWSLCELPAVAEIPLLVPGLVREEERDCQAPTDALLLPAQNTQETTAADSDDTLTGSAERSSHLHFRVGCVNRQEAIESAEEVRGTSFAELSSRMQPLSSAPRRNPAQPRADGEWNDYSVVGFLKRDHGLKALLLADNDLVLTKLAMASHQALVGPLLRATRLHRAASQHLGIWVRALRFQFGGRRFTLLHEHSSGCQQSPFADGTSSGQHFCLVNEQTQGRLGFEGLAPVMAFRYGFYQNGRYRLDPAEVKRVLHEG